MQNADPRLLRLLDQGIEDMAAGRMLLHKDAMKMIQIIIDQRKEERKQIEERA